MPERYIEDATNQCTPITRPYIVKVKKPVTEIDWDNTAHFALLTRSTPTADSLVPGTTLRRGSVIVSNSTNEDGASAYLTFSSNIVADQEVEIRTTVTNGDDEKMTVELLQQDAVSGEWYRIDSAQVLHERELSLKGFPKNTSPLRLQFKTTGGPEKSFEVSYTDFVAVEVIAGSYVSMDCNNEDAYQKDYRFGFNTQEKTNEIAGVRNHNTAMFWEYDTRLGRRWNLDPVPQVSFSDYSTLKDNPIMMMDWLGNSTHTDSKGNVVQIKDNKDLGIYKHDDLSKWNHKSTLSRKGKSVTKMDETWTPFGFADFEIFEESKGKEIVPGEGARIDFESQCATTRVKRILGSNPDPFEYALAAKSGGDWDIKHKSPDGPDGFYFGSKLAGNRFRQEMQIILWLVG